MDKINLCPELPGIDYKEINKTSDLYRTCNLPKRFDNPNWFYGYGVQMTQSHPCYRTNSSDYGREEKSSYELNNEMLKKTLESSFSKLFGKMTPDYYFQQDNVPCHMSQRVTQWFRDNGIEVLDWPTHPLTYLPVNIIKSVIQAKEGF